MEVEKLLFIQNTLYEWGQKLIDELKQRLKELDIQATGDLLKSLSYQVFQASEYSQGEIHISFAEWGRMVDMGAGRAPKIESVENNLQHFNQNRKPQKFYSKTAYGLLNLLISNISHGFQDEIIDKLKNSLQDSPEL